MVCEYDEISDSTDHDGSDATTDQATLGAAFIFEIVFFV